MLTKPEKTFATIYALIVCTELISSTNENLKTLHYISKPAIVISLIFFFIVYAKTVNTKTKNLTLLALICSVVGDILLMFVDCHPNFFIGGLISFLLAHLMFVKIFYLKRNSKNKPLGITTILLLYAFGLFFMLKDNLGDLLIPVLFYMAIILLMVILAFLRLGNVSKLSFYLVFFGALCFIISDSLLALNKFYKPIAFENISIMLTYALAQLGIVLGIKKQV